VIRTALTPPVRIAVRYSSLFSCLNVLFGKDSILCSHGGPPPGLLISSHLFVHSCQVARLFITSPRSSDGYNLSESLHCHPSMTPSCLFETPEADLFNFPPRMSGPLPTVSTASGKDLASPAVLLPCIPCLLLLYTVDRGIRILGSFPPTLNVGEQRYHSSPIFGGPMKTGPLPSLKKPTLSG